MIAIQIVTLYLYIRDTRYKPVRIQIVIITYQISTNIFRACPGQGL